MADLPVEKSLDPSDYVEQALPNPHLHSIATTFLSDPQIYKAVVTPEILELFVKTIGLPSAIY